MIHFKGYEGYASKKTERKKDDKSSGDDDGSMRPLFRYMIYTADNAVDKDHLQKIWQMVSLENNRGEVVRKRIGDFACYLAFIIGLNIR